MVDRDDGELGAVTLNLDVDGGLVESGVDVVHGDGVVRVCGVAADIADNAQLAIRRLQALHVDERWDGLGEVDAVDKDVRLNNLRVWARTLRGLGEIPFLDV